MTSDLMVKRAAVRLMKARMRYFAYEQKSKEVDDKEENIWSPMLLIEQAFIDGAKQEWGEVLRQIGIPNDGIASTLGPIVEEAFQQARKDTASLLEENVPNISKLLAVLTALELVQPS